ncbi:hypothetical protein FSP39_004015 [Pinctada imbricata]|uniref:Uncharacterized protein n=1 Tax=Pinctada imbricata TaxID=66713 RepID=A0AA88YAG0_PINIB|nr:hypothetical protein FSP39_004015 [Pinctada imbricata]
MIDTRVANLGMDVAEDMINALENVIAVICHMSGPSKMPLFGLYGLDNTSEMLLPLTHLKGNLSRIQTSLRDLRSLMESAINETLSGCIEQAIKEAYGQFRRQVYQSIRGIPDSCQQLEIILMTQQPREIVQRQLDTVAISLESQYLTKIQVVIIGHGFDNECTKGCDDDCSQGSSVGSNESPLSGIIEITRLDACGSELIIKCDLRERLINPSDLPFKEEYPMVVQPTACWRMDWDELESQQQNFKSLCIELFEKSDDDVIFEVDGFLTSQDKFFKSGIETLKHRLQNIKLSATESSLVKGVLFHQDSAPVHKPVTAMTAIHDCGFNSYSPDLASSDFHSQN